MGSFKKYLHLTEMPHYLRFSAECPEGDEVDGNLDNYKFDYGGEFFKQKYPEQYRTLDKNFGMMSFSQPTGILPVYCNVHDLLFMFDFDNNIYIKPRHKEDLLFLSIVKYGIKKVRQRDKLPQTKIKIFK